jgi:hypothetical protein
VIAKCGFDRERGFTVEVFVDDELTSSGGAADMNGALEILVEHGFFAAADLKSAHEMIIDEPNVPMPDGPKRAFEAIVCFLRVAAD